MKRQQVLMLFAALSVGFLAPAILFAQDQNGLPATTPLDDYIAKDDGSYKWNIVEKGQADGIKTFVINMTSQTWRKKDEVNRTEWKHWLTVAVPNKVKSTTGFLWIGGGKNGGKHPKGPSEIVTTIARATGTIVAELKMVPNQPLIFDNDGKKRVEDDLIAYTWNKYLDTGDSTWPARNPMVKSAVKAMDTMINLSALEETGTPKLESFVVAGGSKRGWTTWLTGAVDDRVVAIVPIVIDVLNLDKTMRHHFAAYGFWSPAVGDYIRQGLPKQMDHPRMPALIKLVDPYAYRHRLTKPKYIVNASGDQFFPPDLSRYSFGNLEGEKHLRYVPNAEHSLRGTDAIQSIIAFYSLILTGKQRPEYTWKVDDDGTIRVKTVDAPKEVLLWQATNPEARDFRLESLGPKYKSTVLKDQGDGNYVAKLSKPEDGFTASFVELTYDIGLQAPLKFTSRVVVTPDTFPHKDKDYSLPLTITIKCIAPNKKVAQKIKATVSSKKVNSFTKQVRFSADKKASKNIRVHLNWAPNGKGNMEAGAGALGKMLKEFGCKKIQYQLESGPSAL